MMSFDEADPLLLVWKHGKLIEQRLSQVLSRTRPFFLYYKCDVCDCYPIRNFRWACAVCDDFDECNACFEKSKKSHDSSHPLIRFPIKNIESPYLPKGGRLEPKLTDSTLKRISVSTNLRSATGLKSELSKLGLPLDLLKRCKDKNAECCLRLFETGCDVWRATLTECKADRPAPARWVKRLFMHNALILSELADQSWFKRPSQNSLPLDSAHVAAALLAMLRQVAYRDDEEYGWFGAPVDTSEPLYFEIITDPSDLGTIETMVRKDMRATRANEDRLLNRLRHFARRLELVWDNALRFNSKDHPVYVGAEELRFMSGVALRNVFELWEATSKEFNSSSGFPWRTIKYIDLFGAQRRQSSDTEDGDEKDAESPAGASGEPPKKKLKASRPSRTVTKLKRYGSGMDDESELTASDDEEYQDNDQQEVNDDAEFDGANLVDEDGVIVPRKQPRKSGARATPTHSAKKSGGASAKKTKSRAQLGSAVKSGASKVSASRSARPADKRASQVHDELADLPLSAGASDGESYATTCTSPLPEEALKALSEANNALDRLDKALHKANALVDAFVDE